MFIVGILIVAAVGLMVCGGLGHHLGRPMGRPGLGLFLRVFFGPIGLVIIALMAMNPAFKLPDERSSEFYRRWD